MYICIHKSDRHWQSDFPFTFLFTSPYYDCQRSSRVDPTERTMSEIHSYALIVFYSWRSISDNWCSPFRLHISLSFYLLLLYYYCGEHVLCTDWTQVRSIFFLSFFLLCFPFMLPLFALSIQVRSSFLCACELSFGSDMYFSMCSIVNATHEIRKRE